jgi:hypothetical protein
MAQLRVAVLLVRFANPALFAHHYWFVRAADSYLLLALLFANLCDWGVEWKSLGKSRRRRENSEY